MKLDGKAGNSRVIGVSNSWENRKDLETPKKVLEDSKDINMRENYAGAQVTRISLDYLRKLVHFASAYKAGSLDVIVKDDMPLILDLIRGSTQKKTSSARLVLAPRRIDGKPIRTHRTDLEGDIQAGDADQNGGKIAKLGERWDLEG